MLYSFVIRPSEARAGIQTGFVFSGMTTFARL